MNATKTTARRVCFSCGHLIRIDETVCTYCAAAVVKPEKLTLCKQCGQKVSPVRAICNHCSLDMTEPCPACGTDIRSDWAVCPCCGYIKTRAGTRAKRVASSKARRVPWIFLAIGIAMALGCFWFRHDIAMLFADPIDRDSSGPGYTGPKPATKPATKPTVTPNSTG